MVGVVENYNNMKNSAMHGNTTDQDSIRGSPFPRELHERTQLEPDLTPVHRTHMEEQ